MSDVYRRKNVLLLSYFVSSLGYFSLSFSGAVWMLVLSRVPSGEWRFQQQEIKIKVFCLVLQFLWNIYIMKI